MSDIWTGSAIPVAEACVTGPLLERYARETPNKIFALFEDGSSWTYAETLAIVQKMAGGLRSLGVAQGDYVNV